MRASKESPHGQDESGIYDATREPGSSPGAFAAAREPHLPIGTVLGAGRFAIQRRIGAGGMGIVYEAHDRVRACDVALKTLTRLDGGGVYQLKNEFRSLADVAHANLVALHELFAEEALWFFTMDLVDGVGFDRWVRPGPTGFDEPRLRAALAQLLDGLEAIHDAGKLHRDLKPSNVLVTADGRVVVLDFGLATDPDVGGVGRTLAERHIAGTPEYMAPEQADGSSLSAASDCYAVGVMLFEALTGRLPFEGHFLEMLVNKRSDPAPSPSAIASGVPPDLEALCLALLAREPAERPTVQDARWQLAQGAPAQTPVARRSSAPPLGEHEPRPLFGREAEVRALSDAYAAAARGPKPVVVLLGGESGIGKSALAEAVLRELSARGDALVLSGRCFERESVPFKGFDAIVDRLSRHLRRLSAEEVRSLLPRDVFALRRLFPVLGRIESVSELPGRDADPQTLRQRAFAAFGELLGRIGDRQPLVLHFDDLQWSDADSTALLMHVLRQPDAPRVLVIAAHRSERTAENPCLAPLYDTLPRDARLDVRTMALGPLPAHAAEALLAREGGQVTRAVALEAGGNPYLLSELARHAAVRGADVGSELSLREVVSARVASLPEAERGLLQVLAVASRPIPLAVAGEAAGMAAPYATFVRLRSEALARSAGDGQLVECFHDKVREALLATLDAAALARHHRALAQVLARGDSPDHEHVAAHLLGAGDGAAAARELAQAADAASVSLSFDLAARLYELALLHGQFDAAERQRLRVARAHALAEAGRGVRAADAYLVAMEGAAPEQAVALQQRAAEHYLRGGELARGLDLLIDALARIGIHAPRTTAETFASVTLQSLRLRLRGHRHRGRPPHDARQRAHMEALHRAAISTMRLDVLHAVDFFLGGALLALDHGDRADVARAMVGLIPTYVVLGQDDGAIERAIARAEALGAEVGDAEITTWLSFFRGLARTLGPRHEPESAVRDFDQCIESFATRALPGSSYELGWMRWNRAFALVSMGELAQVGAELPVRLDEALASSDHGLVPMWSGATGLFCTLADGDVALARHNLEKGLSLWREPEATSQELSLRDGEVLLHLYEGDPQAAWDSMEGWFEKFRRSPMRHSILATQAHHFRALAALALAEATESRREREQLLHLVDDIARRIDSDLLRGALACRRGDVRRAISALRAVGTRTKPAWPVRLNVQAAQRRLGVLIGGDEGRALVAAADTFLSRVGVRDPERFVAMLTPGAALG